MRGRAGDVARRGFLWRGGIGLRVSARVIEDPRPGLSRERRCGLRAGSDWALAGEGVGFLVRMADLLIGPVAVRRWDLARAAKAEKVGFGADIAGHFFIF